MSFRKPKKNNAEDLKDTAWYIAYEDLGKVCNVTNLADSEPAQEQ